MKVIIKYQWNDRQRAEVLEPLSKLKQMVYAKDIQSQLDHLKQYEKNIIRYKVITAIARVKKMRKITEEYRG